MTVLPFALFQTQSTTLGFEDRLAPHAPDSMLIPLKQTQVLLSNQLDSSDQDGLFLGLSPIGLSQLNEQKWKDILSGLASILSSDSGKVNLRGLSIEGVSNDQLTQILEHTNPAHLRDLFIALETPSRDAFELIAQFTGLERLVIWNSGKVIKAATLEPLQQLQNLQGFECSGLDSSAIEFLKNCPSLTSLVVREPLKLSSEDIQNLTQLKLTQLSLNLAAKSTFTAADFAGFQSLTHACLGLGFKVMNDVCQQLAHDKLEQIIIDSSDLKLPKTGLKQLTWLKKCPKLKVLQLESIDGKATLPWEALSGLEQLSIKFHFGAKSAKITGINNCHKLVRLSLTGAGLTDKDLNSLAELNVLKSLKLSSPKCYGNFLSELSCVESLENLELVECTNLKTPALKALAKFASLKVIDLRAYQGVAEEIDKLDVATIQQLHELEQLNFDGRACLSLFSRDVLVQLIEREVLDLNIMLLSRRLKYPGFEPLEESVLDQALMCFIEAEEALSQGDQDELVAVLSDGIEFLPLTEMILWRGRTEFERGLCRSALDDFKVLMRRRKSIAAFASQAIESALQSGQIELAQGWLEQLHEAYNTCTDRQQWRLFEQNIEQLTLLEAKTRELAS